jgi:hypothetical protein
MKHSETKPLRAVPLQRFVQLLCWWRGCDPDYEHPCELAPNYIVPCKRCGAADTDYADRVGETRENAAKDVARRILLRWWLPEKCGDCGKRYGTHHDCVPF